MSPYITTKHKYLRDPRYNKPRESVHLLVSFNLASLALALAAAFAYLWLLNVLVSRGYVLKALDERLALLHETGEKLNRDVTALRSLESLSLYADPLGLVAAGSIPYAKPPSAVAQSSGFTLP